MTIFFLVKGTYYLKDTNDEDISSQMEFKSEITSTWFKTPCAKKNQRLNMVILDGVHC